jgi:hypothetical protein
MAITKSYTREMHDAGRMDAVEAPTSTGQLRNYGVSAITSTGGAFTLAAPRLGLRKTIVDTGSTASTVIVNGSTYAAPLELVGLSTSTWGVIVGSTV